MAVEDAMRITMELDEVKSTLAELVDTLAPGDEVVLTRDAKPVAKLVSQAEERVPQQRPAPGFLSHMILHIADDFDAPLECMKEYME
jgi:antitoxin (DNA-binding transcriptional repressor) of toxin-antitoxin stability system